MRLTIAYSKINKRNLVLINNDTHQRETLSERPIRPPLNPRLHQSAAPRKPRSSQWLCSWTPSQGLGLWTPSVEASIAASRSNVESPRKFYIMFNALRQQEIWACRNFFENFRKHWLL